MTKLEQPSRNCSSCKHSDNGKCAYTEECHECMWDNKYDQQPCEDCISREQTLKAFAEKCGGECACCEYNGSGYDTAENCKLIKSMPSVTSQQIRWIPVSERLPEDGRNVLFCDIDEDIMVGYHIKGRPDTHFSQQGTYDDIKNVKAWMPLPQPYEAENEENVCGDCYYNDGEVHAECVICDKAESEVNNDDKS